MSATTRDDTRTPLAMGLAVALHVLVAVVLLVYFWKARAPMMAASEHVFELVTTPSPTPDNAPASSGAPAPAIRVPTLPSITKMPPLPPASKSSPVPVKTTPPPVPPQPVPATQTTPKMETIDQFHEKYSQPAASSTPARATTARAVPVVRVDDSQIQKNLQNIGTSAGSVTDAAHSGQASSGVTNDYLAGLVARLQAAYESPPELLDADLAAEVEITIAADGKVIGRRLTKTSGNPVFDAAVEAALARVTMVDPPPNGEQAFIFTFKNVTQ